MAWLETRSEREYRKTKQAIENGSSITRRGTRNISYQLLEDCKRELDQLDRDYDENDTRSFHEIEARKEAIYDLMKSIRKANTGKRTWAEFLAEKKADMLLPENIKGNKRLLGACGVASAVAVGVLLPMVAVLTGPLGVGAIAGAVIAIAVAAVVLFAVCKLLSAVFKGLFN
ncbi:MAG: hypothetical protein ACO1N3_00965, partial [Gammaproteobacteria bacterium]